MVQWVFQTFFKVKLYNMLKHNQIMILKDILQLLDYRGAIWIKRHIFFSLTCRQTIIYKPFKAIKWQIRGTSVGSDSTIDFTSDKVKNLGCTSPSYRPWKSIKNHSGLGGRGTRNPCHLAPCYISSKVLRYYRLTGAGLSQNQQIPCLTLLPGLLQDYWIVVLLTEWSYLH